MDGRMSERPVAKASINRIPRLLVGTTLLVGILLTGGTGAIGAGMSLSAAPAVAAAAGTTLQADQIAAGSQVFEQICSKCHGDAGQGGDGPALIGAGSAAADYRNGKRLFDFLSSSMPEDAPGSLSAQQYYDVIAFVMNRNGWNAGGQTVDATSAEGILLQ